MAIYTTIKRGKHFFYTNLSLIITLDLVEFLCLSANLTYKLRPKSNPKRPRHGGG
jgi:hypothetical protein